MGNVCGNARPVVLPEADAAAAGSLHPVALKGEQVESSATNGSAHTAVQSSKPAAMEAGELLTRDLPEQRAVAFDATITSHLQSALESAHLLGPSLPALWATLEKAMKSYQHELVSSQKNLSGVPNSFGRLEVWTDAQVQLVLGSEVDPAAVCIFEPVPPGMSRRARGAKAGVVMAMDLSTLAVPPAALMEMSNLSEGTVNAATQLLLQSSFAGCTAVRLLTMHINAVVGRTLGYASAEEYNALLSDVLSDEPLLQTALQDMALRMLEGFSVEPSVLVSRQLVKGTDQHLVLPLILHPFVYRKVQPSGGPSAARSNRQASSMLTSTREQLLPAVVIKYQLSAGLINLIQQLHRGYCMTSTMAHSCTIFDLRGRVLHQNKESVAYMGLHQGMVTELNPSRAYAGPNVLQQLFSLSPEKMDDMLEAIAENQTWRGIIEVPPMLTPVQPMLMEQASAFAAAAGTNLTMGTGTNTSRMFSDGQTMSTIPTTASQLPLADQRLLNQFGIHQASTAGTSAPHAQNGQAPANGSNAATAAAGGAAPMPAPQVLGGTPSPVAMRAVGGKLAEGSHRHLTLASTPVNVVHGPADDEDSLSEGGEFMSMRSVRSRVLSTRASMDHSCRSTGFGSTMSMSLGMDPSALAAANSSITRKAVARRRSTLRAVPAAQAGINPLSTSTWGLLGGAARSATRSQIGVSESSYQGSVGRNSQLQALTAASVHMSSSSGMAWEEVEAAARSPARAQDGRLSHGHDQQLPQRRGSAVERSMSSIGGGTGRLMSFIGPVNRARSFAVQPSTPAGAGTALTSNSSSQRVSFQHVRSSGGGGEAPERPSAERGSANSQVSGPFASISQPPGSPVPSGAFPPNPSPSTPGMTPTADDARCSPPSLSMRAGRLPPRTRQRESGVFASRFSKSQLSSGPPAPMLIPTANLPQLPSSNPSSRIMHAGSQLDTPDSAAPSGQLDASGPSSMDAAAAAATHGRRASVKEVLAKAQAARAGPSEAEAAGSLMAPSISATHQRTSLSSLSQSQPVISPQTSAVHSRHASAASAAGLSGRSSFEEANSSHAEAAHHKDEQCFHEVVASPFRDPVTNQQTIMVVQTDVTARVLAEKRIVDIVEAEHKLLESIFPRHVLEHVAKAQAAEEASQKSPLAKCNLKPAFVPTASDCADVATDHEAVTILFADIVGFTNMCKEVAATQVMTFLNKLYTRLDSLLDIFGVYKVETIGDCYMVAGGLMTKDEDGFSVVRKGSVDELHAAKVFAFARAMLREAEQVLMPTDGQPVKMRIGLHSGSVVSGIVGTTMPRFCLFGDTVNTASRMESLCPPGHIHVSAATHAQLHGEVLRPTGGVQVKGKGLMETYVWEAGMAAEGSRRAGSTPLPIPKHRHSFTGYLEVLDDTPVSPVGPADGGADVPPVPASAPAHMPAQEGEKGFAFTGPALLVAAINGDEGVLPPMPLTSTAAAAAVDPVPGVGGTLPEQRLARDGYSPHAQPTAWVSSPAHGDQPSHKMRAVDVVINGQAAGPGSITQTSMHNSTTISASSTSRRRPVRKMASAVSLRSPSGQALPRM